MEQEVLKVSGGKGVNVVYDSVGRPTFRKGLNVLKTRGHMVSIGQAGGKIEPFDISLLNSKGLYICRPMLAHYVATPAAYLKRANEVFELFSEGISRTNISKIFSLKDVIEAQTFLESRKAAGKVLLKIR